MCDTAQSNSTLFKSGLEKLFGTLDTTVEEIADEIIEEYSTTKDEAINAVNSFLEELKASDLLVE